MQTGVERSTRARAEPLGRGAHRLHPIGHSTRFRPVPVQAIARNRVGGHRQRHRRRPESAVVVHEGGQHVCRGENGRVVLRHEVFTAEVHHTVGVEFCQERGGAVQGQAIGVLPRAHPMLTGHHPTTWMSHRRDQGHALPVVVGVIGLPGLAQNHVALGVPCRERPGVVPRMVHDLMNALGGGIKPSIS